MKKPAPGPRSGLLHLRSYLRGPCLRRQEVVVDPADRAVVIDAAEAVGHDEIVVQHSDAGRHDRQHFAARTWFRAQIDRGGGEKDGCPVTVVRRQKILICPTAHALEGDGQEAILALAEIADRATLRNHGQHLRGCAGAGAKIERGGGAVSAAGTGAAPCATGG